MNARDWLNEGAAVPDIVLLGAPISRASISAVESWTTPPSFRAALNRFPTWDAEHDIDIADLHVRDLGDVLGDSGDTDASAAHDRIRAAAEAAARTCAAVFVIGGDNSLTRPAMQGVMAASSDAAWGLLTLDAHHDCRPVTDGSRNGTPVRELIVAGLPGNRVSQIGIHPLGNAREHAGWARAQGIHIFPLAAVRERGMDAVIASALSGLAGAGVERIYVDLDVDVVDRAFAPACPASLPGGLSPGDLLRAAFLLGADHRVAAADLAEVDASADVNGMTVRLAAAAFVSFCAGLASRAHGTSVS
ncbi:MAG TPA: arginase family protein [Candidatus Acidoferrales bacterium]|nr:arginase family protein [Candidatus Acidoferrales bacterium]